MGPCRAERAVDRVPAQAVDFHQPCLAPDLPTRKPEQSVVASSRFGISHLQPACLPPSQTRADCPPRRIDPRRRPSEYERAVTDHCPDHFLFLAPSQVERATCIEPWGGHSIHRVLASLAIVHSHLLRCIRPPQDRVPQPAAVLKLPDPAVPLIVFPEQCQVCEFVLADSSLRAHHRRRRCSCRKLETLGMGCRIASTLATGSPSEVCAEDDSDSDAVESPTRDPVGLGLEELLVA